MIARDSEHIRVEGHYGTWHVIDDGWYALTPDVNGEPKTYRAHCFLLEHDEYGDEAVSAMPTRTRRSPATSRSTFSRPLIPCRGRGRSGRTAGRPARG